MCNRPIDRVEHGLLRAKVRKIDGQRENDIRVDLGRVVVAMFETLQMHDKRLGKAVQRHALLALTERFALGTAICIRARQCFRRKKCYFYCQKKKIVINLKFWLEHLKSK